MPNNQNRKLSAILFADIVGYTSLMQRDETTANQNLDKFHSTLNEKVASYRGQIINNYGDGCVCTFESAVDAMKYAKEVQRIFQTAPKVPVRIGLHSGDVFFKDNNVYGDSVNIASRIESLGVEGAILFSKQIKRHISNQKEFEVQSLGEFDFKNVEKTMEVFALANEGFTIPKKEEMHGKLKIQKPNSEKSLIKKWLIPMVGVFGIILLCFVFFTKNKIVNESFESEKSIAVLPFTDLSPNKDQEYFSDGMMEEILNHLVKIEGLLVSSRSSSMTYKGQNKQATVIAKELGVATILEGSVRKDGDKVRISVQFIDGKTDKHIWSETYDGNLENVFAMQSDIALRVANELRAQITPKVKQRMDEVPTQIMEAYSKYLEASAILSNSAKRKDLLKEAIRLDPEFGEAYVDLAILELGDIIFTRQVIPDNFNIYLNDAKNRIVKGLELSPNYAQGYIWLGAMDLWFSWNFEQAEKYYDKALQLNPAEHNTAIVELLLAKGKFDEALKNSFRTLKSNPNSGEIWVTHGLALYFNNNQQKLDECIEIIKEKTGNVFINGNLFRLLIYIEHYKETLTQYEQLSSEQLNPRVMGFAAIAYYHTDNQQKVDQILSELKSQSAISPIGSPAFHVSMIYAQMGNIDLAFEWLEKSYKDQEVEMYWMKVEPPFEPLHDDPRWEKMLNKVGFPKIIKG